MPSPRPTAGNRRPTSTPAHRWPGKSDSTASFGWKKHHGRRRSLTAYLFSNLTSAIVTVVCGPEKRLFAAHEDVLCHSPYFTAACRGQFQEAHARRIELPEELPEIFSCVLEYLYKGKSSLPAGSETNAVVPGFSAYPHQVITSRP